MTFQTSLRKSGWPFRVTLAVGLGLFCNAQVDSIYAQNWSKTMAPNTNWVSIACSADGAKLIAAAVSDVRGGLGRGPIFMSRDSGLTWKQTSAPITAWFCVACSSDGEKMFASALVSQGEKSFWASTNGGVSWSGYLYPANTYLLSASADGETVLSAGGPLPFLASSRDAGVTWTPYALPVSTLPAGIVVSSDGTRQILCNFDGDASTFLWMYTSTDSGQTWTQNPGPQNSSNYRIAFTGATKGNSLVAVVDLSMVNLPCLFTSSDWGQTWDTHDQVLTPVSGPPMSGGKIACSSDGSKLMASFNTVYASTNWGVSWYPAAAPIVGWLTCSADGRRFFLAGGGSSAGGIYVFDSTPNSEPTRLRIATIPGNLLLSWPATSNGILEQSPILGTTNWIQVPTAPVVTNGEYQVLVVPAPSTPQFFRLKQF